MKILIACEFSGTVRDAFAIRGHDAWSCDLLPTESEMTRSEGKHIQGDVLQILDDGWDMMIAHPPCTYLAVAGLHYSKKNPDRMEKTRDATRFFETLYNADIPRVAIENPVGIMNTLFRRPDQIVDPFNFGTPERKKTCLWLNGLPPLTIIDAEPPKPLHRILRKSGSKKGQYYNYYWRQGKSAKDRSRTFPCIANAMAEQWGGA